MDSEALLGNLQQPWAVQIRLVEGFNLPHYFNNSTGILSKEDPRLGALPSEWERLERGRTADDPYHFAYFRNKETREEINWDPRMDPEALENRGVKIRTFRLSGESEIGEQRKRS